MRHLLASLALAIAIPLSAQNPVFVLNPAGHSARVIGTMATPDEKIIFSFGADKSICIWDAATGRLLKKKWLDTGTGDLGRFIDMEMGSKSGFVALARITAEGKPVVNLIDILNDRIVGTFEGFSHDLGFVRIDPNERFIITGAADTGNPYSEPVRLWKIPPIDNTPFAVNKAAAQVEGISMHSFAFYNRGNDIVITAFSGYDASFHIDHDPSAIPEYKFRKQPLPRKNPGHMSYSAGSDEVFAASHNGDVVLFKGTNTIVLSSRRRRWSSAPGDTATQAATINRNGTFAIAPASIKGTEVSVIEIYDLTKEKRIAKIDGWYQGISFVSDTSFVAECQNGLQIYNVVTGKTRVLQLPLRIATDNIGYGPGGKILFDTLHRIFDFENLQLSSAPAQPHGFSSAKMSFNDKRIAPLHSQSFALEINDKLHTVFPHGTIVLSVSYLNDGRIVTGRNIFHTHANVLLLYDLKVAVGKLEYDPQSLFEGPLGGVTSIAPHPDIESKLFATRDRFGIISLFDPDGPSSAVFQNQLRFWPFRNLNLDVTGKGTDVYALPRDGYTGSLKKDDKLESINGVRPGNKESIIRYLETLDPAAPVDVEVTRGSQKLHSLEKLNAIQLHSQLLSFIPLENNEWLCWTPQGYYAASANGERSAGWVINKGVNAFAEFHPIYDFKKQFYKPDLIKLIARHSSFEKAVSEFNETAAQPLSLSAGLSEKLPPSITWVNPVRDTAVNKQTVRFVASIQSSSKLQSAKILLNGRTILRRDQISIRQDRDSPGYSVSFELDLVATENIVNIFAENEYGTTISAERVLKMRSTETGLEKYKPNLYLLSVGVSSHSAPEYALNYADKDAKSMEQLYLSQQGKLFRNVFTRTLVNEQATRTGILEAFYWLEQNATQKDVVVIFMASHGLNDKDKFYILPYDGDPERIRITGVDWSNFADVLGNLPSKVLVFVDACHSGKLGTNILARRGDTDLMEAIRALATEENGVVIMAASTGKESSLESAEWQHGAFTLALLEGLGDGKADLNEDNIVNIREIDYYVAERVKALTNGRQHPTTQKPSVVSEFPLVMRK